MTGSADVDPGLSPGGDVGHHHARRRIGEDGGDLRRRPTALEGRVDEPGPQAGERDLDELDAVGGHQRDVTADSRNQFRESVGDGPRAVVELAPRAAGHAVLDRQIRQRADRRARTAMVGCSPEVLQIYDYEDGDYPKALLAGVVTDQRWGGREESVSALLA